MPYNKQNFVDGDTLTAENLNHIEDGVYQNEERTNNLEKTVGGTYELVEEITTTENLTSINRTAYPDGTPYSFKAVYVAMTVPAAAQAGNFNIYARYGNTSVGMLGISGVSATAGRYVNYYTRQLYGVWETSGGSAAGMYGSGDNRYIKDAPMFVSDYPEINRVVILAATNVVIPAGTIIKIYGVRA